MRPDRDVIIEIEEVEDSEQIDPAVIREAERILARILFSSFIEHIGAAGRQAEKEQAAA